MFLHPKRTIKSPFGILILFSQAESEKPKTLLPKVSLVLQAFVNARHDIPEHRKFPLFTALGSLLVEHDHLWMLMPLVGKKIA